MKTPDAVHRAFLSAGIAAGGEPGDQAAFLRAWAAEPTARTVALVAAIGFPPTAWPTTNYCTLCAANWPQIELKQ